MSPQIQIVACYAATDEEHIVESIRSVKDYVDRFVVVDSVFPGNDVIPYSTQREVVTQACAAPPAKPLLYIDIPTRQTQVEARNSYLQAIKAGDWALIIDGDEIMYGDYGQIHGLFDDIRSGGYPYNSYEAIDVAVYTVAVKVPKEAIDVTEEEFNANPLISTVGYMPRLVQVRPNLRYTTPPEGWATPALTFVQPPVPDRYLMAPSRTSDFFLVNNHHRQTLESYHNDYKWETLKPAPAAQP